MPVFLTCQDLFLYSQVCFLGNPNAFSKSYAEDVSQQVAELKGVASVVYHPLIIQHENLFN